MHSPRRICATVAAAMARPLSTNAPATTKTIATSATTARYSTAAGPELLGGRMASTMRPRVSQIRTRSLLSRGLLVPGTLHQVAEDDRVAPTRDEHLPVAPAQRGIRPPAVLDEPRLAHRLHLAAGDDDRPAV